MQAMHTSPSVSIYIRLFCSVLLNVDEKKLLLCQFTVYQDINIQIRDYLFFVLLLIFRCLYIRTQLSTLVLPIACNKKTTEGLEQNSDAICHGRGVPPRFFGASFIYTSREGLLMGNSSAPTKLKDKQNRLVKFLPDSKQR